MHRYFLIFLLITSLATARDYFIKLSDSGLQRHKQGTFPTYYQDDSNKKSRIVAATKSVKTTSGLERWFIGHNFTTAQLQMLDQEALIDTVEEIGHFRIRQSETALSYNPEQWYLKKVAAEAAWGLTRGRPEIIVGVIDTGVDYNHDDLQNGLWINSAEDINGNGRLDGEDFNGIDDDGNGYIDDVIGYDFTDAPRFADGGDYLDPDPDPMDEFQNGHGTQAAGIIAGQGNNENGVTGLAPQCRVMCLRAGTASGYLEEDDVARALLYAVENGARVVNMSFGDRVLSRFLKDVIDYAHRQGVLIVASAGNSASNETHYPSGLPQTLSVAASTEDDLLAGFSNFGQTIDVIAPGTEIFSTARKNSYNFVNGTSFSAPLVSAQAALILSQNGGLAPGQLKNLIRSSADDLFNPGWDEQGGSGRINAFNSLRVPASGILEINRPRPFSSVAGNLLNVTGQIAHPDLESWRLSLGMGDNPDTWQTLAENSYQTADTIFAIDISTLPDTLMTLRLKLNLTTGSADELRRPFYVDRSAPQISNVSITPMLDGASDAVLLQFNTDDVCTATIKLLPVGESSETLYVDGVYETQNHRIKLDYDNYPGSYEVAIEVQNSAGMLTRLDQIEPQIRLEPRFNWHSFRKLNYQLPPGYILPQSTDFDNDGLREMVVSHYNENNAFGFIRIYEFNGNGFTQVAESDLVLIPRAAGDADGDGKGDILAGFGENSYMLEADEVGGWPLSIKWQGEDGFWAAAYGDADKDGKTEIIGYFGTEYLVLENISDDTFSQVARLVNESPGANRLGVPRVAFGDVNNNGATEIIFGDYDGTVALFENNGDDSYRPLEFLQSVHPNATEMLHANDENLFVASHTPELDTENEFDARYWSIQFYDDLLQHMDTINTFGYRSTRDFDSGLSTFYMNGRLILAASFYPDLYLFEQINGAWQPVWHKKEVRSNSVLCEDFDGDGIDEIYFNDGTKIVAYAEEANSSRPDQPYSLAAFALGPNAAQLNWQHEGAAQFFEVQRSADKQLWKKAGQTTNLQYADSGLINNTRYFYRVFAVDSTLESVRSLPSETDSVLTGTNPGFLSVQVLNERQLHIVFDKDVMLSDRTVASAWRLPDSVFASTILPANDPKTLFVAFDKPFTPGDYSITLRGVFGKSGVPLAAENHVIAFSYLVDTPEIIIANWQWQGENLLLEFSVPVQTSDLLDTGNYSVTPSGAVQQVSLPDSSGRHVLLRFDEQTVSGARGVASYVTLFNMRGLNGGTLAENSRVGLFRAQQTLDDFLLYPQPVRRQHDELKFSGLPGFVRVVIFSINGNPVRTLEGEPYFGALSWDLKDNHGRMVANGIYLYTIRYKNEQKTGKIAIIK